MDKIVLKATRRTVTGKQVKALRRQGLLPAVMYGYKIDPVSISLDDHDSSLILPKISSSTVISIDLEGEEYAALVRERQRDPVKNNLVHVDFQIVSLTEKIRAAVRVEIHGVSPAVKEQSAIIVTNLTEIEVEALPGDLPERISVDIAKLVGVGDAIYVRDLPVSDKVEVLTDLDEIVVVATGAAPEEVEEEVEEEVSAEPEVIERGKREEEEEEE